MSGSSPPVYHLVERPVRYRVGQLHDVVWVHTEKLLPPDGADGLTSVLPPVTRSISSAPIRFGLASLTLALVKVVFVRSGMAAMPVPSVPITTGVSSIHSTDERVEG